MKFTEEGAERTGCRERRSVRAADDRVVPYVALVYDGDGQELCLHEPAAADVPSRRGQVRRVQAATGCCWSAGPPAGTEMVTVGAAEVYGAELEIAGGH